MQNDAGQSLSPTVEAEVVRHLVKPGAHKQPTQRSAENEGSMGLFGKIVATVVNVATLPVAVVKDVVTLGGVSSKGEFSPYTAEKLKQIKDEAK